MGIWVGNDEDGKNHEYVDEPIYYLSFINEAIHDTSQDKKSAIPAWSLGKLVSMFKGGECEPVFTLSKGGYVKGAQGDEWTDRWFAMYEQIGDGEFYYCENDESAIGAVVKLILKLKGEGIGI